MESIRQIIREAREEKGMTQEQVAEAAGVDLDWYRYLEWNRRSVPSIPILRNIFYVLGIEDPDGVFEEHGLI